MINAVTIPAPYYTLSCRLELRIHILGTRWQAVSVSELAQSPGHPPFRLRNSNPSREPAKSQSRTRRQVTERWTFACVDELYFGIVAVLSRTSSSMMKKMWENSRYEGLE